MTSFTDVKAILDRLVNGEEIGMHGPFWRGVTRDEFVASRPMGMPAIVVGDPANSNIVKALRGLPPFGRDLQPRPAGARINRMPDGFPPASEEQIAYIEQWIADGCPDEPAELGAAFLVMDAGLGNDAMHIQFWREFDNFFLFRATAQTRQIVGSFINAAPTIWIEFGQSGQDGAWVDYLAQPDVRDQIGYILTHHLRLLRSIYGSPLDLGLVREAYWRFGGNLMPPDPLSSGPRLHNMNTPGDWFNWAPFLDAVLREDSGDRDRLLVSRGWHIGLVADGVLRTDARRPPSDRLQIDDFAASDPDLFAHVVAHYEAMDGDALRAEFLRRLRTTDAMG